LIWSVTWFVNASRRFLSSFLFFGCSRFFQSILIANHNHKDRCDIVIVFFIGLYPISIFIHLFVIFFFLIRWIITIFSKNFDCTLICELARISKKPLHWFWYLSVFFFVLFEYSQKLISYDMFVWIKMKNSFWMKWFFRFVYDLCDIDLINIFRFVFWIFRCHVYIYKINNLHKFYYFFLDGKFIDWVARILVSIFDFYCDLISFTRYNTSFKQVVIEFSMAFYKSDCSSLAIFFYSFHHCFVIKWNSFLFDHFHDRCVFIFFNRISHFFEIFVFLYKISRWTPKNLQIIQSDIWTNGYSDLKWSLTFFAISSFSLVFVMGINKW